MIQYVLDNVEYVCIHVYMVQGISYRVSGIWYTVLEVQGGYNQAMTVVINCL